VADQGTGASGPGGSSGRAVGRFFFGHEVEEYPSTWRRTGYLAVAVLATIVLYYTYYTQTGVTPNILRSYHMSFAFYVWIVIVSNLLGAFASLPASKTDRLGRANVIIYGLLVIGLLVAIGVPNAHTKSGFVIVICAIGLVEGAILVATPAMVRDFSPQLGRASAMGFWTVGPVAGSLITSIVANRTLSHFVDWQSQFIISGVTSLVVFAIALVFMKDLSPRLRDQLMVSARDRALIEARARGLSEQEVVHATEHPWRQIVKWDLVGSSFGIAVFLLIYYAAAAFFTVYYSVTFLNTDGTNYTTSQVNGLNTWFWGADIIALIIIGALSDRLRVRKPFMLVGTVGSIATLAVFLGYATHPHTAYWVLALTSCILAFFLSLAYAPWMAGYTETVESKNPALVATGLALWGWILRLVVGISFIFLPMVITSVNPIVDNQPLATHEIGGQAMQNFIALHPKAVAFAREHRALLRRLTPFTPLLEQAAANPTTFKVAAEVIKAVGETDALAALHYKKEIEALVEPYRFKLQYLTRHFTQFVKLTQSVKKSPEQWQHWFWVDIVGMVVFIPTIWLTRGRWSPKRAKQDEDEHDRMVTEELARMSAGAAGGGTGTAGAAPAV
jgi:MFS family permease